MAGLGGTVCLEARHTCSGCFDYPIVAYYMQSAKGLDRDAGKDEAEILLDEL
jgi:hypothetical protein